jgi:hypothetical protein
MKASMCAAADAETSPRAPAHQRYHLVWDALDAPMNNPGYPPIWPYEERRGHEDRECGGRVSLLREVLLCEMSSAIGAVHLGASRSLL